MEQGPHDPNQEDFKAPETGGQINEEDREFLSLPEAQKEAYRTKILATTFAVREQIPYESMAQDAIESDDPELAKLGAEYKKMAKQEMTDIIDGKKTIEVDYRHYEKASRVIDELKDIKNPLLRASRRLIFWSLDRTASRMIRAEKKRQQ